MKKRDFHIESCRGQSNFLSKLAKEDDFKYQLIADLVWSKKVLVEQERYTSPPQIWDRVDIMLLWPNSPGSNFPSAEDGVTKPRPHQSICDKNL